MNGGAELGGLIRIDWNWNEQKAPGWKPGATNFNL